MRPKNKPKIERRRYPRMRVPVFYRAPRIHAPKRRITNLSLGGFRIYSDERLDEGEQIEVEFFLPDGSTVKALAEVVWIEKLSPGAEALFDSGLKFVELKEEAVRKLKSIIGPDRGHVPA